MILKSAFCNMDEASVLLSSSEERIIELVEQGRLDAVQTLLFGPVLRRRQVMQMANGVPNPKQWASEEDPDLEDFAWLLTFKRADVFFRPKRPWRRSKCTHLATPENQLLVALQDDRVNMKDSQARKLVRRILRGRYDYAISFQEGEPRIELTGRPPRSNSTRSESTRSEFTILIVLLTLMFIVVPVLVFIVKVGVGIMAALVVLMLFIWIMACILTIPDAKKSSTVGLLLGMRIFGGPFDHDRHKHL